MRQQPYARVAKSTHQATLGLHRTAGLARQGHYTVGPSQPRALICTEGVTNIPTFLQASAESDGIFQRLTGALALAGRHRVSGIPEQRYPTNAPAAEIGPIVDISPQDRLRVGRTDDRQDQVVPPLKRSRTSCLCPAGPGLADLGALAVPAQ